MTLLTIFAAAALAAEPADKPASFKSGPDRVNLVELYSSEGCSSCPPADDWLSGLAQAKGLWTDFVPMAFEVDYWDAFGWKDPLASPDFSRRQQAYAASWGTGGVYTPGFVLNGREWRGWGEAAPKKDESFGGAGQLGVAAAGRYDLSVLYKPEKDSKGPWVVHAALLGMGFESKVRAGENEGKKLRHDFVALDFQESRLEANVPAKVRLRRKPGVDAKRYAAAVWVTKGDSPAPVQAAGGFLP